MSSGLRHPKKDHFIFQQDVLIRKSTNSYNTHKDLTDTNLKPGIYRIPCTCGKVYIGETGRNLKIRQKEHKDCCRKCQLDKSALAKHSWENDHLVKWDESELLVPEKNYFSRQIRESVEIFLKTKRSHKKESLFTTRGLVYLPSLLNIKLIISY